MFYDFETLQSVKDFMKMLETYVAKHKVFVVGIADFYQTDKTYYHITDNLSDYYSKLKHEYDTEWIDNRLDVYFNECHKITPKNFQIDVTTGRMKDFDYAFDFYSDTFTTERAFELERASLDDTFVNIIISFNEQYVPINCMNIFNRIEQRYRSLEERLESKEK